MSIDTRFWIRIHYIMCPHETQIWRGAHRDDCSSVVVDHMEVPKIGTGILFPRTPVRYAAERVRGASDPALQTITLGCVRAGYRTEVCTSLRISSSFKPLFRLAGDPHSALQQLHQNTNWATRTLRIKATGSVATTRIGSHAQFQCVLRSRPCVRRTKSLHQSDQYLPQLHAIISSALQQKIPLADTVASSCRGFVHGVNHEQGFAGYRVRILLSQDSYLIVFESLRFSCITQSKCVLRKRTASDSFSMTIES